MKKILSKFENIADKGRDFALLFVRLVLAYGLWVTAIVKWQDMESTISWFENIGIIAPKFNAYLAASTEMAGVFLLMLGLGSRLISIPLMITMIVAIKTVHWEHGFEGCSNNGFETPLYYLVMLFVLVCFGSGRISVDHLIKKFSK